MNRKHPIFWIPVKDWFWCLKKITNKKEGTMMKKVLTKLVVAILLAISIGCWSASALAADPIKVDFISFLNLKQYDFALWKPIFIDKINERARGELRITVRGGPEAIPIFNQAMAVKQGVVDMMYTSVGFYSSLIPGIASIRLSEISPKEERENGAFEYIDAMAQKAGFKYLGRGIPSHTGFFWLFLKKKAKKPEDFKGMKIGASPIFFGFLSGLGTTPTGMPLTDYYTALERGVIDGHIASMSVFVGIGSHEVAKYAVRYPYWSTPNAIMFNLKKWNSLPPHLQKLFEEAAIEQEKAWPAINKVEEGKIQQKAIDAGVEFYELPPETAKFFHRAAYDKAWEDDAKKYPAKVVNGLRALIEKK
jgi:TRAP-type C4-dicarboxylate transport system substrate-binding protein